MIKKTIVVVEDNPDNQLLVKVLLGDLYNVKGYDNGYDGLLAIQEYQPDLVLLDVSLPQMDGFEVLQALRHNSLSRHTRVVALTAHVTLGDEELYQAKGFDGFIGKPIIDLDTFRETIASYLALTTAV